MEFVTAAGGGGGRGGAEGLVTSPVSLRLLGLNTKSKRDIRSETVSKCTSVPFGQLLRSSLVNNRTQAKVAEELGMQEYAITNDKTKRPVALRTKTLADLLECESHSMKVFEPANSVEIKRTNIHLPFSHYYYVLTKDTSFLFSFVFMLSSKAYLKEDNLKLRHLNNAFYVQSVFSGVPCTPLHIPPA